MATSLPASIPKITRLSSAIIRILGSNPGPMTLQGTNTYLLGTGNKRILIDTGDQDVPEYIESLCNVLEDEKATIGTVILTHWHHDHIGGVKDVAQLARENDCMFFKFPRTDAPDVYPEIPQHIPFTKLEHGQEIAVEGAKVRIVHTPGHTTDHVILTMEDGSLFSGDCILGEGTAVFEDLSDYMKSLHKILKINPTVIYPGHGNIISNPMPKIQYYIDHRCERECQILQVFESFPNKKFNELDIVKIIYKETPENLWPAAAFNVNHHLRKLTKEGYLLAFTGDDGNIWKLAAKSNSSL